MSVKLAINCRTATHARKQQPGHSKTPPPLPAVEAAVAGRSEAVRTCEPRPRQPPVQRLQAERTPSARACRRPISPRCTRSTRSTRPAGAMAARRCSSSRSRRRPSRHWCVVGAGAAHVLLPRGAHACTARTLVWMRALAERVALERARWCAPVCALAGQEAHASVSVGGRVERRGCARSSMMRRLSRARGARARRARRASTARPCWRRAASGRCRSSARCAPRCSAPEPGSHGGQAACLCRASELALAARARLVRLCVASAALRRCRTSALPMLSRIV